MSNQTLFLTEEIYGYMRSFYLREAKILSRLREETSHLPMSRMQISPEQGQFMALLIKLINASRTIEIGVFTGYSSLCVALALPASGKLVACDINSEWTVVARRYWEEAGVEGKVELHLAPAIETLDRLLAGGQADTFDFVFIDADKENYDGYYERALSLMRPGGLMAIDNVFWSGRVADSQVEDRGTESIRRLNGKIHRDRRVEMSMIPIGDGLTLVMKKEGTS
jgi:predicted O-methyltransferase YrrM